MEDISSDYAEKIVRDWVRDSKKAHSVLWAFDQLILTDDKWFKPYVSLSKMLEEFDKIDVD